MNLKYRILSVDPVNRSIVVRYFSDQLSELDLNADPADKSDPPVRCVTDYNLTLWAASYTEQELHDFVIRSAPHAWLDLKSQAKQVPLDLPVGLVGETFSVLLNANGEIDLPLPT